ncbi:hypothetical protein [Croceibacterium aestuarii]|uniref:hypothetical protein n=1 Tax=Croceibacterium aestuarii TaxID=3064139 RepID=UPI00272ED4EB|nr:hypothetical protein [Croceibacterium sp. D39]
MPFNPFSALTSKIFGAAAIALLIALGVVMWRADHISKQRDEYQRQAIETGLKLHVSNQSIATLEKAVADLNEQAEQRAAAFAEAQELAKKRDAELAAQRKSSNAKIARLRALAEQAGDGTCEATPDLLRELEGL